MANYDGFAGLGELIAGAGRGPDNTSTAYLGGMREGYQTQTAGFQRDKTREDARRARAMAIARDALPEAIRTAGYDPKFAPLAAAVLGSNSTVDLDQLGDMAVPTAAGAFYAGADKLRGGDIPGYNDELAIATGEEREPYELAAAGKAVFRGDTGDVALTELGDASVDASRALELARAASASAAAGRERASDAGAAAQTALAEQRRRTTEAKAAGTGNPAVAASTPPVANARKAPDGFWYVPDPARPGKWMRVDSDG